MTKQEAKDLINYEIKDSSNWEEYENARALIRLIEGSNLK